jgi:hypothetical protein
MVTQPKTDDHDRIEIFAIFVGVCMCQAQNKSAGVKETSTTSLREAIKQWEDNNNIKISDVEEVKLVGLYPPLEKLDQHMQTLSHVQLSSDFISTLLWFDVRYTRTLMHGYTLN